MTTTHKHHHHGTPPLAALKTARLETHLRDVIGEMRRRPSALRALRSILSGELDELKAEALAGSHLTADKIAELCETRAAAGHHITPANTP